MRVQTYLHEMFVRRTIPICAVLGALASGASAQTGLVRPVEEVILQSEVAGVVSEIAVVEGQLAGGRLAFSVQREGGRTDRYSARVSGEQMSGEVREGDTVIARWSATRAQ